MEIVSLIKLVTWVYQNRGLRLTWRRCRLPRVRFLGLRVVKVHSIGYFFPGLHGLFYSAKEKTFRVVQ